MFSSSILRGKRAIEMQVLLMVLSMPMCAIVSFADVYEGTATYYTPPYVSSACPGNSDDQDFMIAAASDAIWDNKEACGRSYLVKCIGPTNQAPHEQTCHPSEVVVKIVDRCHGCSATINLSQEAFSQIANMGAGRIKIKYEPFD